MASHTQEVLDKAWRSTCRVLFGEEVGGLSDCAEWLKEYGEGIRSEKSAISGKSVAFSQNDYAQGAPFVAFDEIDYSRKFAPLSINEIKDIDGLVSAVRERMQYTGNVVLGHSSNVSDSSNVVDSHFVTCSSAVSTSKYIGYSWYVKESEYCFGLFGTERGMHSVKCMGSDLTRCFECHMVNYLSDCYYCAKTQNCHECFFCFGMENGSHAIGNTQIEKGKYLQLKAKLLSEISEGMRGGKGALSLLRLIEGCSGHNQDARLRFDEERELPFDISPIDQAFGRTCSLLFGREMGPMEKFRGFLNRHVPQNVVLRSPLSGKETVVCGYRAHLLRKYALQKRLATEEEMRSIGRCAGLVSLEGIRLDSGDLVARMHPIAYTNLDKVAGNCSNFKNCGVIIEAQDCCNGSAFDYSKKCAYDFWVSHDEAVFGSCATFYSSFALKSFYSNDMTRCFECDGCKSCADAYFLHNCENVRDSMFCFNAKNLANAIGNASLPPEQYRRIKSAIVQQLADELEKKKDLKWDIFSIGAGRA